MEYAGRSALIVRKFFIRGLNYFDDHYGEFGADLDLAFRSVAAAARRLCRPTPLSVATQPLNGRHPPKRPRRRPGQRCRALPFQTLRIRRRTRISSGSSAGFTRAAASGSGHRHRERIEDRRLARFSLNKKTAAHTGVSEPLPFPTVDCVQVVTEKEPLPQPLRSVPGKRRRLGERRSAVSYRTLRIRWGPRISGGSAKFSRQKNSGPPRSK